MNIELIRKQLSDLEELTKSWSVEVATIERDLALDKVKKLYDELRFAEAVVERSVVPEDVQEPEVEVEITYYEGDDEEVQSQDELHESEDEEVSEEEETMEVISIDFGDVSIVEDEPEPEESKPEESKEKPEEKRVSASAESSLFDLDTIPVRSKSRRSAILSLYSDGVPHDEPKPTATKRLKLQPTTPPQPQPQPSTPLITPPSPQSTPEPMEFVIEEIEMDDEDDANVQSVGETFAAPAPTIADMYAAEQNSVGSVVSQPHSSINDQYIIAQELFGGDVEACEEMLAELEMMDNFEDSMIYIAENFDWNPDCEAVKLVLKLLDDKYALK